jgi:DNA-binding protein Fis
MYSRPDIQHLKDEIIIDALVRHKGSHTKAAKELGINKKTLKNKMVKSDKIQAELRKKQLKGYMSYPVELDERIHQYMFETNGVLEEIVKLLVKDEEKGLEIKSLRSVPMLQNYLNRNDKTSLKNDLYNARTRLISNMSVDDLALLINHCHGNISLMAQKLFIPYASMWARIDRNDYLRELQIAAEGKMYSDAKHFLQSKMNDPKVDVKIRADIAKMIVMNHPTAKRDGWGKNSNVKPKDNNALESITVEVVSSQEATTSQPTDDVIDADISDQEQIVN